MHVRRRNHDSICIDIKYKISPATTDPEAHNPNKINEKLTATCTNSNHQYTAPHAALNANIILKKTELVQRLRRC